MSKLKQTTAEMLAEQAADPLGAEAASARRDMKRRTLRVIEGERREMGWGDQAHSRAKTIHDQVVRRWLDALAALRAAGR